MSRTLSDKLPETETVRLASLKPHPRNYRTHPEDQLEHLAASIKEHGFYRNLVVAQDGTILAGHGVAEAALRAGLEEVRVVRLPIPPDSPQAIKVLTGDNEIEHLAEQDDRLLSELLKELAQGEASLLGTGYDEMMLANLVMVTRPATEIRDFNEAAHWVGLPTYGEEPDEEEPAGGGSGGSGGTGRPFREEIQLVVNFDSEEDRERFMAHAGIDKTRYRRGPTWSTWWPEKEREDLASLRYEAAADE